MKSIAAFACLLIVAAGATAGELPHWGYSGANGPDTWATLCTEFGGCTGHNQSPINLTGFVEAELPPLAIAYLPGGSEILNNGHAVQVNYGAGSTLVVDGITFALKQFHFHSPSENQIDGKPFALEIHYVHADADGNLAVISVMVSEGAENAALAKLWAQMPAKTGDKNALKAAFDGTGLLPKDRDYFRFNGSLTTPPCTEGVRWLVMKAPVSASKAQVAAFTAVIGHPNNRPVQATNARLILK